MDFRTHAPDRVGAVQDRLLSGDTLAAIGAQAPYKTLDND
jgi:hypothetical protein